MSFQSDPFILIIDGQPELGGRVALATFAESVSDWLAALRQTAADKGGPKTKLSWVVQDLEIGSALLSCQEVTSDEESALVARETKKAIVLAINHQRRGGNPREFVTDRAAVSLLRLIHRVEVGEAAGIHLMSGKLRADIVPVKKHEVPRPILAIRRAIGSIEGELVSVSFAQQPTFAVRTDLDAELVSCYFDAKRFPAEQFGDLLCSRVSVSGVLTERANGEVASVSEVDGIYRFPPRAQLPQPGDVVGIDPELTDGLSAEEFVRRRRA